MEYPAVTNAVYPDGMGRRATISLIAILSSAPAHASVVTIAVNDGHGRPVANAVVELTADLAAPAAENHVAAKAVIDQRHETFLPLVSVIRKGGEVVFTNNDTTMHQVYSFSAIKQFQFEIDQGQRSQPVVFDKAGVASIGCNIHDQMITYVYVADTPFAAITDAKGHAQFADVPAGAYHVNVWHPQLAPGKPAPSQALAVPAAGASLAIQVPLLATPMAGMKHMHMGNY
jgi:plastocyanin